MIPLDKETFEAYMERLLEQVEKGRRRTGQEE